MRKNIVKYIMFDFDGTIVDSMPFLEDNAVNLLTKYRSFSTEAARQRYRETTGLPFIQQMDIIAPNNDNSQIIDEFEKMKLEKIYQQHLFADTRNVLRKLKQRGYKLGISSGTIESIITKYLETNGLNMADDILGWRPGFEKGKDHFDFVAEKYRYANSNLAFVGDSINDAKRAEMNSIFFIGRSGMFQLEDFQQILPKITVVSSLTEVLPFFPHLDRD